MHHQDGRKSTFKILKAKLISHEKRFLTVIPSSTVMYFYTPYCWVKCCDLLDEAHITVEDKRLKFTKI